MHRTDPAARRHRFRIGRPRPARIIAAWHAAHPDRTITASRADRRRQLEAARGSYAAAA